MVAQYLSLPPELQSSILSYCTNNDITCLSLTCKTFYSLYSTPDPTPLCGNQLISKWRSPSKLTHHDYMPFYDRHRNYRGFCSARGPCQHLNCYDCELWLRLRSWMPKGTRYCRDCRRFTMRDKRRRKGACRCLGPSPRRIPNKNWTYRKNTGFAYNFWKKFYTEADLARTIRRFESPRVHVSTYSLRKRPTPTRKRLEHTSLWQFAEDASGNLKRHDFTN